MADSDDEDAGSSGFTVLFNAIRVSQTDYVRKWFENPMNAEKIPEAVVAVDGEEYNATILHYAVSSGDVELVRLLLRRRAKPNALTKFQSSPLQWAARDGRTEVASVLLRYGADLSHTNMKGETAATMASKAGHQELAKLLQSQEVRLGLPVSVLQGQTAHTPIQAMNRSQNQAQQQNLRLPRLGASPNSPKHRGGALVSGVRPPGSRRRQRLEESLSGANSSQNSVRGESMPMTPPRMPSNQPPTHEQSSRQGTPSVLDFAEVRRNQRRRSQGTAENGSDDPSSRPQSEGTAKNSSAPNSGREGKVAMRVAQAASIMTPEAPPVSDDPNAIDVKARLDEERRYYENALTKEKKSNQSALAENNRVQESLKEEIRRKEAHTQKLEQRMKKLEGDIEAAKKERAAKDGDYARRVNEMESQIAQQERALREQRRGADAPSRQQHQHQAPRKSLIATGTMTDPVATPTPPPGSATSPTRAMNAQEMNSIRNSVVRGEDDDDVETLESLKLELELERRSTQSIVEELKRSLAGERDARDGLEMRLIDINQQSALKQATAERRLMHAKEEVKAGKAVVNELNKRLEDADQEYAELKKQLAMIEQSEGQVNSRVLNLEQLAADLQQSLTEVQGERDAAASDRRQAEAALEAVKRDLEEAQQREHAAIGQATDLRREKQSALQQVTSAEAQMEKARESIVELEAELDAAKRNAVAVTAKEKELSDAVAFKQNCIADLEEEAEKLKVGHEAEVAALKRQLARKEEDMAVALASQENEHRMKLSEVQAAAGGKQAEVDELKSQLQGAEELQLQYSKVADQAQAELRLLKKKIEELESELRIARREGSETEDRKNARISQLEDRLAAAEKRAVEHTKSSAAAKSEREALQELIAVLEERVTQAEEASDEANAELERLRPIVSAARRASESQSTSDMVHAAEVEASRKEVEQLKVTIAATEQSLEDQVREKADLQASVDRLTGDCRTLRENIDEMEKRNAGEQMMHVQRSPVTVAETQEAAVGTSRPPTPPRQRSPTPTSSPVPTGTENAERLAEARSSEEAALQRLQEKERQLSESTAEVNRLKAEVEALAKKVEATSANAETSQQMQLENVRLKERLAAAEASQRRTSETESNAATEVLVLRKTVADLQARENFLRTNMDTALESERERVSELEAELCQERQARRHASRSGTVGADDHQLASLRSQLRDLEGELSRLEIRNQMLEEQREVAAAEVRDLQSRSRRPVSSDVGRLALLERQVAELEAANAMLQQEVQHVQREARTGSNTPPDTGLPPRPRSSGAKYKELEGQLATLRVVHQETHAELELARMELVALRENARNGGERERVAKSVDDDVIAPTPASHPSSRLTEPVARATSPLNPHNITPAAAAPVPHDSSSRGVMTPSVHSDYRPSSVVSVLPETSHFPFEVTKVSDVDTVSCVSMGERWLSTAKTPVEFYVQQCMIQDVKPNASLMASLGVAASEVRVLDVSRTYVGRKGIRPVLDLLHICPGVVKVNMSDNRLDSDAIVYLLDVAQHHPKLTTIVADNNLIAKPGLKALQQLLTTNNSVVSVSLRSNPLLMPAAIRKLEEQAHANTKLCR